MGDDKDCCGSSLELGSRAFEDAVDAPPDEEFFIVCRYDDGEAERPTAGWTRVCLRLSLRAWR